MIKVKNYTLFYSVKDPLSNFYPCVFYYLGKPYLSIEHFYVTQKLIAMNCLNDLAKLNACLKGSNFLNSFLYGRITAQEIQENPTYLEWFHNYMKQVLLDTKDDILVECSPYDYFWGVGISKISTKEYIEEGIFDELNKGDNQLGKSLMKIRQSII